MKIQITEGTIVEGKDARPGTVLDVDPAEARKIFIAGKAIPVPEAAKKPTTRKKPTSKKAVTTKTAKSTIKGKK